ncbi:MAG: NlpC/P60 family protein [Armatimonadota bacterium]
MGARVFPILFLCWLTAATTALGTQEPADPNETALPFGPVTGLLSVDVREKNDGLLVTLTLDGPTRYRTGRLLSPPRFFVDLEACELALDPSALPSVSGIRVRASQFTLSPPVVRVALDLGPNWSFPRRLTSSPSDEARFFVPRRTSAPTQKKASPDSSSSERQREANPTCSPQQGGTGLSGGVQRSCTLEELLSLTKALPHQMLQVIRRIAESCTPYRFGGDGLDGLDCSGFTCLLFSAVGIQLPHSAAEQFQMGTPIDAADLKPGDLVFFGTSGRPTHVGVALGSGSFLHVSSARNGLTVTPLNAPYYAKRFMGARRLFGFEANQERNASARH